MLNLYYIIEGLLDIWRKKNYKDVKKDDKVHMFISHMLFEKGIIIISNNSINKKYKYKNKIKKCCITYLQIDYNLYKISFQYVLRNKNRIEQV